MRKDDPYQKKEEDMHIWHFLEQYVTTRIQVSVKKDATNSPPEQDVSLANFHRISFSVWIALYKTKQEITF